MGRRIEHHWYDIDKLSVALPTQVATNQPVALLHFGYELPARRTGLHRNVGNRRVWQRFPNLREKLHKQVVHVRGGFFAIDQVVFARINYHLFGLVGDDDAVSEVEGVAEFGAAEAAIEDGFAGKVVIHVGPKSERRTAYENNRIFGRGRLPVCLFKRLDGGLPFVLGLAARATN